MLTLDNLNWLEINQLYCDLIKQNKDKEADEVFAYMKYYWPDMVED